MRRFSPRMQAEKRVHSIDRKRRKARRDRESARLITRRMQAELSASPAQSGKLPFNSVQSEKAQTKKHPSAHLKRPNDVRRMQKRFLTGDSVIIRILYNKTRQNASTFLLPRQRISAQDIVRFCGCYSQDVVILYNIVYVLLCAFLFFGENAGYVGLEFKSVYEILLGAHAVELLRRVEAEFPRRDGGNVILKMPRLFFTAVK